MKESMVIQGRIVTLEDIQFIKKLLADNPRWHRTKLSQELCKIWNWRASNGQIKDIACRTFLLKLEKLGHITLPPQIKPANNSLRNKSHQYMLHQTSSIHSELKSLSPLNIVPVKEREEASLFKTFLSLYHYLGYRGIVGENMRYIVYDREDNPLGCMLFGSAAWRIEPRDRFLCWDSERRKRNLHLITNNMRFLILPWVKVAHLGSHILGQVGKRISTDWINRYGHPIYLLETFVECERFRGTIYKAANWIYVGKTKGRTRNDRCKKIRVPIKDIYLYPTSKDFKEKLLNES